LNRINRKENNYGSLIKKYRDDKGYTQEFMAHQLNITQNSYSNLENGKSYLRVDVLEEIAKILEINPVQLMKNTQKDTYKLKQKNHDESIGLQVNHGNFENERKIWQELDKSRIETIDAQKLLIEELRKTKNKV
jgi:transcriptional regulator with XRE-family HTH domain